MYTTEELAGVMAACQVAKLNIRDKEGRKKVYELELYKLQNLEGAATITPDGDIKFIK
jgi:hypothetical protein